MIAVRTGFLTILLLLGLAAPVLASNSAAQQMPKYLKGNVTDLAGHLQAIKGHKLLFIYASWCPYCRQKFPDVMAMNGPGKVVVPISVDQDEAKLIRYLNGYQNIGTPTLQVYQSYGEELSDMLSAVYAAKTWDGSIPHVVILDENDKILLQGNYELDAIAKTFLGAQ